MNFEKTLSRVKRSVRDTALAVALAPLVIGSALATTTYRTTALTKFPNTTSLQLNAIGPAGVIVGQSHANLTDNSPVLWNTAGDIVNLTPGVTGPITEFYAADINTMGQVLLQAGAPYLWIDGTLTPVHLGIDGTVTAFNDAGQIVGTSTANEAFLSSNGTATIIAPYRPSDINNKGQVVLNQLSNPNRAWFWENGALLDLGTLAGDTGSFAAAINAAGQVVGSSSTSLAQSRAVLWENGVIRDLGGAEFGASVVALDINDAGHIVGAARTSDGRNTTLLWADGAVRTLSPVLGQVSEKCRGVGINNPGEIAVLCRDAGGDQAFRLTPVATGVDVGVVVTPSASSVPVGGTLNYQLAVTNAGATPVTDVSLMDVLPAGVSLVSATPSQGSCSGTSSVTCSLGNLAGGAGASVQIAVIANTAGTLTNQASVTAREADVNALNDVSIVTVAATASAPATADLGITLSDSPDPVRRLRNLTYSINVRNAGPNVANGVNVSDTLPSSMRLVSATSTQGSCSGASTITCSLGNLASGASASVSIVVQPSSAGTFSNTATVRANTADPNTRNNSAAVSTRVR